MDEIDEVFREDELRSEALEKAIIHCSRLSGPFTPNDIVSIANTFYQFLKGETK